MATFISAAQIRTILLKRADELPADPATAPTVISKKPQPEKPTPEPVSSIAPTTMVDQEPSYDENLEQLKTILEKVIGDTEEDPKRYEKNSPEEIKLHMGADVPPPPLSSFQKKSPTDNDVDHVFYTPGKGSVKTDELDLNQGREKLLSNYLENKEYLREKTIFPQRGTSHPTPSLRGNSKK